MHVCSAYLFDDDTATPRISTYSHTLPLHVALPISVAPCARNPAAIILPMPRLPPVTSATRPSRRNRRVVSIKSLSQNRHTGAGRGLSVAGDDRLRWHEDRKSVE